MEEYFTRPNPALSTELEQFLAALVALFADRSQRPQGKLILSFRKEWLAEIEKRLSECELPFSKVFLERLDEAGVIEAVSGVAQTPALQQHYGLTIEEGLADEIVNDLLKDREAAVAPMLQILLTRLWEEATQRNRARPRFDRPLYDHLRRDGLKLQEFLDRQLARLKEQQQEVVDSGLALDLLTFHTTPLGTAEQRDFGALRTEYRHRSAILTELVRSFQNLYLLVDSAADWADTTQKSRLAHDTLAPLVRQRFEESDAPGQRARRILENRAIEWDGVDDPSNPAPLDRPDLQVVEEGQAGMRMWKAAEEKLIEASRKERERRQRLERTLRIAAIIALLLIIASAGFAWQQWGAAEIETKRALKAEATAEAEAAINLARRLASEAQQTFDPELRLLLAVEAIRATVDQEMQPLPVAMRELQSAIEQAPLGTVNLGNVLGMTIDPRERWIALQRGSDSGTAKLVDLTTRKVVALPSMSDEVSYFSFSAKGRFLAATGGQRVQIFDTEKKMDLQCSLSHNDYVFSATFSSTEALLLTTTNDIAQLWDVSTCLPLGRIPYTGDYLDYLNKDANAVFNKDDSVLVLQSKESIPKIELWDITTPASPVQKLSREADTISFNHDASLVGLAKAGVVTLIDTATGATRLNQSLGETKRFQYLKLSLDGKYFLTSQLMNEAIHLWRAADGASIREIALKEPIKGYDWVSHVKHTAFVVWDGKEIMVRDAETGELAPSPPALPNTTVRSVEVDPNGEYLLIEYNNGLVWLWDIANNVLVAQYEHRLEWLGVSMAFSPTRRYLVTLGRDVTLGTSTLRLWSLAKPDHAKQILPAAHSLFTLMEPESGKLALHNVQTGETALDFPARTMPLDAQSANHRWLATYHCHEARNQCDIDIWDWAGGQPVLVRTLPAINYGFAGCVPCRGNGFSTDGRWLALWGGAERVNATTAISTSVAPNREVSQASLTLWDVVADQPLPYPDQANNPSSISAVVFSPREPLLAILDEGGLVRLWRLNTNPPEMTELPRGKTDLSTDMDTLAFSSNGLRLAATGSGGEEDYKIGTLRVWDVHEYTLVHQYNPSETKHAPGVARFAFTPDGKSLFVVLEDDIGVVGAVDPSSVPGQQIHRWDVDTLKPIGNQMAGQSGAITAMTFYTGTTELLLAAASTDHRDYTVRIWNADTGELLHEIAHPMPVIDIAFTPDGRELVTLDEEHTLRRWPLDLNDAKGDFGLLERACKMVSRNFTKGEWEKYLGNNYKRRPTCAGFGIEEATVASP